MTRRGWVILSCLALSLASCSRTQETTTSDLPDTVATEPAPGEAGTLEVTVTGIGPVHAGMTVVEASQALGSGLIVLGPSGPCHYVKASAPAGVAFMVVDGFIARVDIDTSAVATSEGAHVGYTEEQIQALYPGRVEVTPHKYTDGHYLTVTSADGTHAIVFETDGSKVVRYRSGRLPEVKWIEGCS